MASGMEAMGCIACLAFSFPSLASGGVPTSLYACIKTYPRQGELVIRAQEAMHALHSSSAAVEHVSDTFLSPYLASARVPFELSGDRQSLF